MKNITTTIFILSMSVFAKDNIAVMELESNTDVSGFSSRLRSELFKTGKFTVIERSQMNMILKEQGFQQTGCTSTEYAVEAGQLIGVKKIVIGSIDRISYMYSINIRIVDVETGKIEKDITDDCQHCDIEDVMTVTIHNAARKLAGLKPDKIVKKKTKETKLESLEKDIDSGSIKNNLMMISVEEKLLEYMKAIKDLDNNLAEIGKRKTFK